MTGVKLEKLVLAQVKLDAALKLMAGDKNCATAHVAARLQCSIDLLSIEIDLALFNREKEAMKKAALEKQDEALAGIDGRPHLPPLDELIRKQRINSIKLGSIESDEKYAQSIGRADRARAKGKDHG